MAGVIEELKPDRAYVDASDVKPDRYGDQIKNMLSFNVELVSEHKADSKYLIVSAASILAKVKRDSYIKELQKEYGDFGTGYPHDQRTIKFLKKQIELRGSPPSFVRKSWRTVQRIMEETTESNP